MDFHGKIIKLSLLRTEKYSLSGRSLPPLPLPYCLLFLVAVNPLITIVEEVNWFGWQAQQV